jgi:trigger factor
VQIGEGMREDILEKFVLESDIAVPEARVDEAYEHLALEITHKIQYESMMTGKIYMPSDVGLTAENIREAAYKQVKTELVLEDVIRKENIELTQDEIEAEAKVIAERQQTTIDNMKRFFGEDLSMLKNDLLIKKAIDFITA